MTWRRTDLSTPDLVAEPAPHTGRAPKIVARGVEKAFRVKRGERVVLRGIDLAIAAGEFVCILGPSGCGKSTLLAILCGFEAATRGEVTIDAEPVREPDPRRVLVFQEPSVFPWASVRENVALGLRGRPEHERARTVQHYVDLVGLGGFEDVHPGELSGGMKQRVAVARALAVRPDVLLMDEPFGALDALTRLEMRAELLRIWQCERMTVVFVTHDVDEALQLADRVVVMSRRPGKIVELVPVTLPHPRRVGTAAHAALRDRILELLGITPGP